MAEAAYTLRNGDGLAVDVDGRRLRLVEPVKGDPGSAVLRTLGLVEELSPVGAAAHGPTGVAAGVWRNPELYLVRWTKGKRWVVGYRLGGGSKPTHYVRTEGRIPTRFEIGNWYGAVPAEVDEAFLEGDLLLEDPPFRVPPAPPPPPAPAVRTPAPRPKRVAAAREPRAATPKPPPVVRTKLGASWVCPKCRMHKVPSQFVTGSDLCVDCR